MPSLDTLPCRITKKTVEELEKIREGIARELGIDKNRITKKQAEIAFRLKASRGRILKPELNDILLGKIK